MTLGAIALTAALLLSALRVQAQNATLATLHAFMGNTDPSHSDGASPGAPLVQDTDGNFYGTTFSGGPANAGTVFKMTSSGMVTILYSFTGGEDGLFPTAGLVKATDGNFYGTTTQSFNSDSLGGTVFRITLTGTLTVLTNFPGGVGGSSPYPSLVQGSDGLLYGTTFGGGGEGTGFGAGTVFTIDPTQTPPILPTVLHAFSGGPDGGDVYAGVVESTVDGNFYGTTNGGGIVNSQFPSGTGTVFKLTTGGKLTTLHTFTGGPDGANPRGGLVQGSDGNFYGTTVTGDINSVTPSGGTVFKITSTGTLTTLHTLTLTEGSDPIAPLIQGTDGNFYGTAETGGESDGTVFKITPTGTLTVLYTFNGTDGRQPQAALLQGSDGSFYGTTAFGVSAADDGQTFRLDTTAAAASPTLGNISTRANVQTDSNVLIGGFIITGTAPKQVIVRGIGPSLSLQGVTGVLANPTLELHKPDATVVTDDDWKDTQEQAIMDTGLAPTNDLESAIVATLDPGVYTVILAGKNGGTGIGLVEAYDLDSAASSQLANISTRGFVETGNNVMIGGFIIVAGADASPSTVVLRGIGPSLTAQGVVGALQDPNLELHDVNGALISSNNDWKDGPDMQTIIDDGLAPTEDKESALLAILQPGAYTAIVSGVNNTTGVGLVEAYNLQ